MRYKSAHALAALALATLAALSSAQARQQPEQQQDEKVIDDFVTTRGVVFDTAKPTKPKPSTQPQRRNSAGGATASSKGSVGAVSSTKKGTTTTTGQKKGAVQSNSVEVASDGPADSGSDGGTVADGAKILNASTPGPIALGYTIYMKDEQGALFRIDPSREYRTGDNIALELETNTDGYLYIFDAENGKNPLMLYPNVQLDAGSNAVGAHVRETYPADAAVAFTLTPPAATEHIYVVISREPLAGVPTGEALATYCAKSGEDCYWRPTTAQWARIVAGAADRHVTEAKSTQLAQADTRPVAPVALARGIKIKKTEPKPSVVRVNDSPAAKMLVTKIEIAHK
jgi:Domain of unknown function (DUF4384)